MLCLFLCMKKPCPEYIEDRVVLFEVGQEHPFEE